MELETLLYLDGTTANISAETSTCLMRFDKSIDTYTLRLEDNYFEWHNNMWMEK